MATKIIYKAVAVRAQKDWKKLTDLLDEGWSIYWSDSHSKMWAFILTRDEEQNG